MKKFLAVIIAVVLVCTAFVACSKKGEEEKETTTKSAYTTGIATEEAKIKEGEAIDFIKTAYSEKELGLDKVEEKYSLMVAQSAVEIEGKKYVKVAANVMTQNEETNADGQTTYSLTPVGEYYISFDGKTVLMKNMETGEYSKLKNKYDEYSKQKAKEKDKEASADTTKK